MEVVRGAAGLRCLRAPLPAPQQALLVMLLCPSPIHAQMLLSLAPKTLWTDCLNSGESLKILLLRNGMFWCFLFSFWVWVSRVMPVIVIIKPTFFSLKWDLRLPLIASFHRWSSEKNIKHFKTYNKILRIANILCHCLPCCPHLLLLLKTNSSMSYKRARTHDIYPNQSAETHFASQANLTSPSLITAPF